MKAERLTRKTCLKRASRPAPPERETVSSHEMLPAGVWTCGDLADYSGGCHGEEFSTRAFSDDRDVLAWCAGMASESPTAASLLSDAADRGWVFGLSDLSSGGFDLDVPAKICRIDHHALTPAALARSAYFRNAVLLTFIRALRDIWHEEHTGAFERDCTPESVLMLERIRAADGDTVAVFCGWELRGAGYSDIWRHLIGSEEGDMAMIFSRFLERDPSALFNGTAMAYAFRQWYADEIRVNACDHDTLQYLDAVLEQAGDRNPFGADRARAEKAESLSDLPDGARYLEGLGEAVLTDPFFAGLGDEINQAHLLHLKYDLEVVMVGNVPFRDSKLARRIFPGGEITRTTRV